MSCICPAFTQRYPVATATPDCLCCGQVNAGTAEYKHDEMCRVRGWSPDARQQSIQRYWSDIASDPALSPASLVGGQQIVCGDGSQVVRVGLFDDSLIVCASIAVNVYNTALGNVAEARVYRSETGTAPYNVVIPHPPGYSPRYVIGVSAGCGTCPVNTACIGGVCTLQPGPTPEPEPVPPARRYSIPTWVYIVISVALGLVLLGLIALLYMSYRTPRPSDTVVATTTTRTDTTVAAQPAFTFPPPAPAVVSAPIITVG